MNFKKSFLGIALAIVLAVPSFAAVEPSPKEEKESQSLNEIKNLIQNLNLDIAELDQETVKVRFIVNDDNELIVLSTDNAGLDKTIKYSLNYKSLKSSDLEHNRIYILPVSFKAV